MVRVGVLLLAAGCFAPEIATGIPCSSTQQCPAGQVCDLATNRCEDMAGAGIDAGVDAPPVDTAACEPGEVLVGDACSIPLATEVAPAPASAADCDTGDANNGRAVAIDGGNRLYVAFRCGATRAGFVAVSSDGGATVGMPVPLGVTGIDRIAILGGPRKHAFIALAGSDGVAFARTDDGGATWSTQPLDAMTPDAGWGISLAAAGSSVFVAAKLGTTTRVWRNTAAGVGAFASTDVGFDTVFGELVADPASGAVWLAGDTPSLRVRKSTDGAATFAAQVQPPGSYNFSEWALGGGGLFVTGTSADTFTRIALADPTTTAPVAANLPSAVARGRALAVAPDETVYVANQGSNGATTILRFAPGSATGASRAVSAAGAGPHVVAGPGTAAPYAFTDTGTKKVMLGVAVF